MEIRLLLPTVRWWLSAEAPVSIVRLLTFAPGWRTIFDDA